MDEQNTTIDRDIVITNERITELKQKYSQELKNSPENPIKICIKLIFDGATERDKTKRSITACQLSEFLTGHDGIINLFLALIDFDSTSQKTTTHNQRFIAVANIITWLPELCMPYEDYCINIYKQLKPLLVSQTPKYSSLASIIIKALIDSPHAKERGKNIRDLIVKPILGAFSHQSEDYHLDQAIIAVHHLISNQLPVDLFIDIFPHIVKTLRDTPSDLKPLLNSILVSILTGLKPGAACCLIERLFFYDDIPANTILSIIEASDNELLVLEFYFHFQNAIWTAKNPHHRELSASLIEPFLEDSSQEGDAASKFDIFNIIAMNRRRSLELVVRTLVNHKTYLSSSERSIVSDQAIRLKHVNQSMSSCISILEVLCATKCDKDDDIMFRMKCYPVLKELNEVLTNISDKRARHLLDAIGSFLEKSDHKTSEDLDNKIKTTQELEFTGIVKDLNDKLVPVRVHALVRLKQMILLNDPFILPKIPQLYSMIECSLADDEPYVFLACINLLAEMAVRDTSFILPKLIEIYGRQDIELQNRMNAGEVLVRLFKQLNETTPFYAQQVMNTLLNHCKDSEELIRMSSLVNIGEICKYLASSLGKYMVDILVCIRAVLATDALPVKCAAVDLLRTALTGTEVSEIEAIQMELKEIYGILKRLRGSTIDDRLCLQVDLALDEIDRVAREMLAGIPSDKLTKNIRVLSLL